MAIRSRTGRATRWWSTRSASTGEHGITAIPGGGYRTEKSRLVERYRLLKDGALLSVTFTWTDPTVFRTPHSYEYRYHRLPATYEPRQWLPCDPYDEERAKFLEPPRRRARLPRRGREGVTSMRDADSCLAALPAAVAAAPLPSRAIAARQPSRASRATGFASILTAREASTASARRFPPAQLLPGVTAGGGRGGAWTRRPRRRRRRRSRARPNPEGVPYIVVAQPCGGGGGGRSNGGLLVNPDSGGVHFVEQKDEVIFAGERGGVRHILPGRTGASESVDARRRQGTPSADTKGTR